MTKKIFIEGMSCSHCSGRVEKALNSLDEVSEAVVNLEGKYATVTLKNQVSEELLKDVVKEAGYDVVKVENL